MLLTGMGDSKHVHSVTLSPIRRAVMVDELGYTLLAVVKGERGLFCFVCFSPQQSLLE